MRPFKIRDEKVTVIPNRIDLEEFKIVEKKRKSCRVILYVGRLEKYKGVQYLIMALPKLANDTILDIVGKGSYKRNLAKLARKLGIESGVKYYQDLSWKELLQEYLDADTQKVKCPHAEHGGFLHPYPKVNYHLVFHETIRLKSSRAEKFALNRISNRCFL